MLARLQHAHIVPIHSVHDDPATGLRLMCMPYLGGANLAQVLEEAGDVARRGPRAEPGGVPSTSSAGKLPRSARHAVAPAAGSRCGGRRRSAGPRAVMTRPRRSGTTIARDGGGWPLLGLANRR